MGEPQRQKTALEGGGVRHGHTTMYAGTSGCLGLLAWGARISMESSEMPNSAYAVCSVLPRKLRQTLHKADEVDFTEGSQASVVSVGEQNNSTVAMT